MGGYFGKMEGSRRIVVVGVGSIGRRHARLLKEHQTELLVELCEPSQQMLDQAAKEDWFEHISTVHSDFPAMLGTEPYAVIICTPHHLHCDMTVAALKAGCHVLCEKPMSDNLADAERMAAAAQEAARTLVIGFNNHFHPVVIRLKELVDTGTLGAIRHAHAHIGTLVTLLNSGSRYQKDLEGALLLDYAHQPDLLYWLLGKVPRGVYMQGVSPGPVLETSTPNVAVVTLDFEPEEQLVATYHLNYIQMPERSTLELTGDRGWAVVDMKTGRITLGLTGDRDQANQGGTITEELVESERDPMYVAEHSDFLQAAEGGAVQGVRAADGLVSMRVIDAALRSYRGGGRVAVAL